MKLTEDQKRVKIAEACGFTPCPLFACRAWGKTPDGMTAPFVFALPDYFHDLNAMAQAEKRLRTPQGDESDSMAEGRMIEYAERLNYCIDATAAQRAEAFGRALCLWTAEDSTSTSKETL